jgi:hypothetical protein
MPAPTNRHQSDSATATCGCFIDLLSNAAREISTLNLLAESLSVPVILSARLLIIIYAMTWAKGYRRKAANYSIRVSGRVFGRAFEPTPKVPYIILVVEIPYAPSCGV